MGLDFVVVAADVCVQAEPAEDAPVLATLQHDDRVEAADVELMVGIEWVRLPRGAAVIRKGGQRELLGLDEDGFVCTEDCQRGTLLRRELTRVAVDDYVEEGALSRSEIQEILSKCHNTSNLLLPLESKYWARKDLELFVMSAGTIRPKWCSVPQESMLANANMSQADVERALAQAAAWICSADVLLVGSGAGMGVDSGLSTFRGKNAGVWPGLEDVGLAYEDICHPRWFTQEPHLAWAFWDFCHKAYQATAPHAGYDVVREWAAKVPLGAFSFTSNIDSHWAKSKWKEGIVEVHGAVRWLQCSKPCCPDVWRSPACHGLTEDPVSHRVRGKLPTCPKCGAVARPNVQMFGGDTAFGKARRSAQVNRYEAWLKGLEAKPGRKELKVVCVELGCGLTVPTVRKELEAALRRFPAGRLVRVNPENPGLAPDLEARGVSIPLKAGDALQEIDRRIRSQEPEMCNFFVRDNGVNSRGNYAGSKDDCIWTVEAPLRCTPAQVLYHMEKAGVQVEYLERSQAEMEGAIISIGQHMLPEISSPSTPFNQLCYTDFRKSDSEGKKLVVAMHARHVRFANRTGFSPYITDMINCASGLYKDLIKAFERPEYQAEVNKKHHRREVRKLIAEVHDEVLPRHDIEPTGRGYVCMQMKLWITALVDEEVASLAAKSRQLSRIDKVAAAPSPMPPPAVAPAPTTAKQPKKGKGLQRNSAPAATGCPSTRGGAATVQAPAVATWKGNVDGAGGATTATGAATAASTLALPALQVRWVHITFLCDGNVDNETLSIPMLPGTTVEEIKWALSAGGLDSEQEERMMMFDAAAAGAAVAPPLADNAAAPATLLIRGLAREAVADVRSAIEWTLQPKRPDQAFKIEIDDEGNNNPLQYGDTIFLKASTGMHLDAEASAVAARFADLGIWQRLIIDRAGHGREDAADAGPVHGGDAIRLWTHAGALLDADEGDEGRGGGLVRAIEEERQVSQTFFIDKLDGGNGPIMPGETMFLRTPRGGHLAVMGECVWARPLHPPAAAPLDAVPPPLKVALTKVPTEDDLRPDSWELMLPGGATIGELRIALKELYVLDDGAARRLKFLSKMGSCNFMTLKEGEQVRTQLFVGNIQTLRPPSSDAAAAA